MDVSGNMLSAEPVLDVRVGGAFRITMRAKDRTHEHTGTYQIVDPPRKLAFTWFGLENPSEITLVTVEFLARGEESELIITHQDFIKPDVAQRYEMGWVLLSANLAPILPIPVRNNLGRNSRSNAEPCKEPGRDLSQRRRTWLKLSIRSQLKLPPKGFTLHWQRKTVCVDGGPLTQLLRRRRAAKLNLASISAQLCFE